MRKIYQMLESIKASEATVLITGETGTGKELIANSIHYNSPRQKKPLISVNCGAIPRELMEREFFGHVKGAYTGAVNTKKGYFSEADGGTLFLGYAYPGNVRELEHIIERYCLLGRGAENLFAPKRAPLDGPGSEFPYDELLASSNPLKAASQKARLRAERDIILHVLQVCNNDYAEAAGMLNIGLSSLYRKLKEIK